MQARKRWCRYGFITMALCWWAGIQPVKAQYRILHAFHDPHYENDGARPCGSLTLSGAALYGMTSTGGSNGVGTVFKINTDGGGYTILSGRPYFPDGSLTFSGATLYGMTVAGGVNYRGTVFKINADGNGHTTLHSFNDIGNQSINNRSLVLSGSTLYGMTLVGGSRGYGTVFKMNTDGSGYTVLHNFGGYPGDGEYPWGSLTLSGSTLYGMTSGGGSGNTSGGIVFKISTDGGGYAILYNFGGNNGSSPHGSLTLSGSMLYGMTMNGGVSRQGVVFKINTSGAGFTILHNFVGTNGDGTSPVGSLALSGSTLYGMAKGGINGKGIVFQINTNGSGYTILHNFVGGSSDGEDPIGAPVVSGPALYGTTWGGGNYDWGVVFALDLPIPDIADSTNEMNFLVSGDYNGDKKYDLSLFNNGGGNWYIKSLAGPVLAWKNNWGWSATKPVPGDYNGDGKHDLAVFDTVGGNWYIKSLSGSVITWKNHWGWNTAKPVAGDYDGDGRHDLALFDTVGGDWYIKRVDGKVLAWKTHWGWSTAKPVPGDYDGDGKDDLALFDTAGGYWYIWSIAKNKTITWKKNWGWSTANPVPGDYDGDGKYDLAVFDTAGGNWYIWSIAKNKTLAWKNHWGWSAALPVPGDYNGDNKYDLAVYDTATGNWYIKSLNGTIIAWKVLWGSPGATAVP